MCPFCSTGLLCLLTSSRTSSRTSNGLSLVADALDSDTGLSHALTRRILFLDNTADGLGGAMFINSPAKLRVSDATFDANEATLGGAIYIVGLEEKKTTFSACVFEGNSAADGGAVYLYTGNAINIFTTSVFRGNAARKSRIFTGVCLNVTQCYGRASTKIVLWPLTWRSSAVHTPNRRTLRNSVPGKL